MSHTKDQETIVLKVLSYRQEQFYEILGVSKSADEGEIKKCYRKLAIKLHPDKNPHPRADEAFKIVNKAWSVLSDPQKKRIFDSTGSDPDSRFNPSMSSNSARTAGGARGGGPFAQTGEFEDIFDFFFNGAQHGAQTFSFGNNGFSFQSFGGPGGGFNAFPNQRQRQQPRNRQQQQQNNQQGDLFTNIKQLLPILIFLLISIIPSYFSESNIPDYSFLPSSKFNVERQTPNFKIPFYVDGKYMSKKNYKPDQLKNFDSKIENIFIQDKRSKCSKEQIIKNELFEEAHGWFSTDKEKLKRAENYAMPNCQVLRHYNLI